MCYEAIMDLTKKFDADLSDVDMVIASTLTSDHRTPSVSAMLHGRLDLSPSAGVMDLNSACAGFVYALQVANALVTSGQCKKVLIVAGETLSKITDYTDRDTCVLFGDGAGAALVEYTEGKGAFMGTHYGSEGQSGNKLYCTGLAETFGTEPVIRKNHLFQDGRAVYTFVIRTVPKSMKELLKKSHTEASELDWFIPHSANLRMIHSICDKLDIPREKALTSLEYFGNTSSATIPLAMWLALKEGKLKKGDKLGLYGFGGGLTHAGVILEW
jgi:3-oxoacyl-[acyl-carrier-protein] synthase-3